MQTLSMVLLYLFSLCAIVFIIFNAQFGIGLEALLNSPFGDRVDTIADAISSNLQSTERKNWSDVLKNFDKLYNVEFYIVDVHGDQLAGKPLDMPKALQDKVIEFPPGMPPNFMGMRDNHGFGFGFGSPTPDGFHRHFPTPSDDRNFAPPDFREHAQHSEVRKFPQTPDFHEFPQPPDFRKRPQPLGFHEFPQDLDFRDFPPPPNEPGMPFAREKNTPGAAANSPNFTTVHGFRPPPFMHAQGRFIVHTTNPDTFFVGTKVMLFDTDRMRPEPSYVLASTNNFWQSTLLFDFKFLLMMAGITLLLSLLFWWPFVHQIARSIGELTTVTEKIADGKFDARIIRARHDEIGRLGEAVNSMAEKLNQYVLTQKRLLADVSHELFSPLARLHMAVELLEDCKPEDSSRHFKEINEEISEMKSLITELLAYSKAGLTQSERQLTAVNLKPIFNDLVAKFGDQMEIVLSLADLDTVEGDATLLSRSFSNVIRNSIRYAGDAGPLTIQTKHEGSEIIVSFSDCGPGVPEETLKYLGEPFFRPEFSRNRNSGGFGLGLAIVKSCIEACNGSVTLANVPTGGLNVKIKLKSVA
jgi:two-component system sensor histidine kinase CpxA